MATPITRSENALLGEAAAEVVAKDPDIRVRVKRLVTRLVEDAEHIVNYGSEKDRIVLIKAVLPAMLKSIGDAEEDARRAEQQEAHNRIMEMLAGDV